MISTDILIIGGGLSGLALADQLHRDGIDYCLVEARSRFGGRIKVLEHNHSSIDLGPSWFWPGQPRMAALTQRFGLTVFEQYARGALSYEDERGQIFRDRGWASMQGSLRIEGGMAALIDSLVQALPTETVLLGQKIAQLVREEVWIKAFDEKGAEIAQAQKVVLALPPRVASQLVFNPTLPPATLDAMRSISTWMAGHAKFVAIYDKPFWREESLSGDAMSRHGPMMEIHDASDPRATQGALFGFLGVPPHLRDGQRQAVENACIAQLVRIFGPQAQSPRIYVLQDWAFKPETATQADHTPPAGHPQYGLPPALADIWDGKLLLSSTESAPQFGGFLEGALEAAEITAQRLSAAQFPIAG